MQLLPIGLHSSGRGHRVTFGPTGCQSHDHRLYLQNLSARLGRWWYGQSLLHKVLPPVRARKLFHRGIFIWVLQRIRPEWQPLVFTVYFSAAGPKSKTVYKVLKADRVLIAWRNFPVSIGPPSAAPQNSPLRAVQRDLGSEYSAHDCGVLGTTWLLFAPISSVIM